MVSPILVYTLLLASVGPLALAIPATQNPHKGRSYDMPLTWTPYGFVTEISIGTPPQRLNVFVDWTWIGQYILTTLCRGNSGATYSCLAKQQTFFNQTRSFTFRNLTAHFSDLVWNPNHFYFYEDLHIDVASDIVTVGPSSVRMTIQAADFQFDNTDMAYPFAGVYGLSPVFKGDNSTYHSCLWV